MRKETLIFEKIEKNNNTAMNSVKQKFNKIGYFIWFIILAPTCVEMKYETPSAAMTLVSWYIWSCVAFFIMGTTFNIIGIDYSTYKNRWYEFVIKDPYIFLNDPFIYAVIFLILFYVYATVKGLWNKEEIKNALNGYDQK